MLVSGGIDSPLLGAELRPIEMGETERRLAGIWLRVIDSTTGQPVPIMDEEHRDLQMTRERLTEEARARQTAEERAARAEAALQALLAGQERD